MTREQHNYIAEYFLNKTNLRALTYEFGIDYIDLYLIYPDIFFEKDHNHNLEAKYFKFYLLDRHVRIVNSFK